MSKIYWHARLGEVAVAGPERAHMQIVTQDLAKTVLAEYSVRGERHPMAAVMNKDHYAYDQMYLEHWTDRGFENWVAQGRIKQAVDLALGGYRELTFTFGGKTHHVANLAGNTAIVTGSPTIALMAKLHGYCESHAWVSEENREWLAGVIEQGRKVNILRADMGWEDLCEFLRQTELFPGPVVTSYSVSDSFPSMTPCRWMDAAWPEEMVAAKSYDYDRLDDDQKVDVAARQDAWYEELTDDQRWDMSFKAIQEQWWLELTPESLTTPTFASTESFWDVVASEEWRNG